MEEVIRTDSDEFKQMLGSINDTVSLIDRITTGQPTPLCGERYYTGSEISRFFNISPRALQNYRDSRMIPYTHIGGKILYPETELLKLLEANLFHADL